MDPFPQDWELLSFFECEPDVVDAGVPWAYNTLSFRTQRGADEIHCKIEPGYETIHFIWSRDKTELINLRMHWVRSIQVETGDGNETFSALFRSHDVLPFVLRLKPAVHVGWGTNRNSP